MVVYVESNFVLELALRQPQAASCRAILEHCAGGKARLVLPAFSIAEPFYALVGRGKRRQQTKESVRVELGEIARIDGLAEETETLRTVTTLLTRLDADERAGLRDALEAILTAAEIVPVDAEVIREADRLERALRLSPQDAAVLASVLSHLGSTRPDVSCFLNRNARDFDDPYLAARLADFGCRVLPSFAGGLGFLRAAG